MNTEPLSIAHFNISRVTIQTTIHHPELLNNVSLSSIVDEVTGNLIFHLDAWIAGRELDRITYPTTWWDAFKLRWFPAWALRRWPAQYETYLIREHLINTALPRNKSCIHVYSLRDLSHDTMVSSGKCEMP